jgi:homoserine O-acetyltransferase/O-succinyltransferase
MLNYYHHPELFVTESGASIKLTIAYATYGKLNNHKNNVVWVCHALTANSFVAEWWPGVVGEGCIINPQEHFIVCANILGSCYGTTGPASHDFFETSTLSDFPLITIRDMVAAHILLRQYLGIESIALLAGGSMGGYQVLEWALMEPAVPQRLLLLATSAAESPWGIAIHEAQRMAIEADCTWKDNTVGAGSNGLKAARAIGIITYRNYELFCTQQQDLDIIKIDGYRAAAYQRYQGEKLARRFNAKSYWTLTKALDSHNIARGRTTTIPKALQLITQPTLVIGIDSDILCPIEKQHQLAAYIPQASLTIVHSAFGHDGFLVEADAISRAFYAWQ